MTDHNYQTVSQQQRFLCRKDFGVLYLQNYYLTESAYNNNSSTRRSETNPFIVDWQLPQVDETDNLNPKYPPKRIAAKF